MAMETSAAVDAASWTARSGAHAATGAADAVAAAAGVAVREITDIEGQAEVSRLLCEVWGRSLDNPPVPPELLRAFGKAGNYIAAAYDGDTMVGATVGFHSDPERHTLHSHIAGVLPGLHGHSVGWAMKLHQRAWALTRGIPIIEWTFDPLIARNAYFNLTKLRATPVEYLANFYGPLPDLINGDDDTDRLLVRWELLSPDVVAAAGGRAPLVDPHARGRVSVAVPADVERLRRDDPGSARRWRGELRARLVPMLSAGGRIVGFDRAAGYIVDPAPAAGSQLEEVGS